MDCVLISTTAGSREEAHRLTAALLGERLVACIQLLPVESRYHWDGEIQRSDELLMLAKTTAARAAEVQERIHALHSYAVPEIVVLPIAAGLPAYLEWIAQEVAPPGA
jgi:periplasmic divalent cation tolerance protein